MLAWDAQNGTMVSPTPSLWRHAVVVRRIDQQPQMPLNSGDLWSHKANVVLSGTVLTQLATAFPGDLEWL